MPDFVQADRILAQLDAVAAAEADPYIRSQYTGFVAVCAVTAFETNVRNRLIEFCTAKHKVFGHYSEAIFEKTNAKVRFEHLRKEYLSRFGQKYLARFNKRLEAAEKDSISRGAGSIKASYTNLIVWRHGFVHDGTIPANPTYEEARASYDLSKQVIEVFAGSLIR